MPRIPAHQDPGGEQAVADGDRIAAGVAVPQRRAVALADGEGLRRAVVDRARHAQFGALEYGSGGARGAFVEGVGGVAHGYLGSPGSRPTIASRTIAGTAASAAALGSGGVRRERLTHGMSSDAAVLRVWPVPPASRPTGRPLGV